MVRLELQLRYRPVEAPEVARALRASLPAAQWSELVAFAAAVCCEAERQDRSEVLVLPAEQAQRVLRELGLPGSVR